MVTIFVFRYLETRREMLTSQTFPERVRSKYFIWWNRSDSVTTTHPSVVTLLSSVNLRLTNNERIRVNTADHKSSIFSKVWTGDPAGAWWRHVRTYHSGCVIIGCRGTQPPQVINHTWRIVQLTTSPRQRVI